MDPKINRILDVLAIILVIIICIITTSSNSQHQLMILILSVFLLSSLMFRFFIISSKEHYNKYKIPSIIIDMVIALLIFVLDKTNISQVYTFILIVDVVLFYSIKFSAFFTTMMYLSFLVIIYHISPYQDIFIFLVNAFWNGSGYAFIYFSMLLVKHVMTQKQLLSKTMKELEYKNQKLEETSKELEEMTIIKERNRIAHEIHDTVGHTLTTVLVEMEAGKRLIDRDKELSKEKLTMAQQQVRKGLNDIGTSVRAIKDQENIINFRDTINNLIQETEKHTEVKIKYDISIEEEMPYIYKKILLRALQEGLTNGIKHGNSTKFELLLKDYDETVKFTLKDNGKGVDNIKFGFGLNTMRERVEELEGEFSIDSSKANGLTLSIKLPIKDDVYAEN